MAGSNNSTRSTSSLSGRQSWGKLFDMLPQMDPEYATTLHYIEEKRRVLARDGIPGKFDPHATGFSPSGNHKLLLEMPYKAALLAKAVYGLDVFTNPKKRRLFLQEHPEFVMTVRR